MNSAKTSLSSSNRWTGVILLALVLLGLFWQSFVPGYVQFNNDGPLGAQVTASAQLPGTFTGSWTDQNGIGSGGAFPPCVSALIRWVLGPLGFAKFSIPIALFILGLGAFAFFRQLQFVPAAAILGALAAMLNSEFFSNACWGVSSQQIGIGMDFFALALLASIRPGMPVLQRLIRIALAGFAVGMNVTEAADIGALFSICIAVYIVYASWASAEVATPGRIVWGAAKAVLVALCAAFIAAHSVAGMFQTQIKGVSGTQQDKATRADRWDFATQWSLPKTETLGLFVPGLFGYRLVPQTRDGSDYWGAIGRSPAWDRYVEGGKKGPSPGQFLRQVGGGNYQGVLVGVVALWAALQLFRKKDSAFTPVERRLIGFWAFAAVISLLLAFGRYAPFYGVLYQVPYVSTIRNPTKFLYILSFALIVLFAYGVNGLYRRYLQLPASGALPSAARSKSWWARIPGFDRNWLIGCLAAVALSLLGWMIYSSHRQSLEHYLDTVAPFGGSSADEIAQFSIHQLGWFILFLSAGVGVFVLILSGALAGKHAKWAGILLGMVLLLDLGRANLPWIVYWDYQKKYEIGGPNPIVRFLAEKPYEHRVAILPRWFPYLFRAPRQVLEAEQILDQLYSIEWAQHTFLYYNVQSLDLVQMPRMPEDLETYNSTFMPGGTQESLFLQARLWELTNTRYILGAADWLPALNQVLDPLHHRFKILQRFNVSFKPGITAFTSLEDVTAVPDPNGSCALFEFTAALPRAKLYSNWQVPADDPAAVQGLKSPSLGADELARLKSAGTNDYLTLQELASSSFDPSRTVLLASPIPDAKPSSVQTDGGTVEYTSYAPKDIRLHAVAAAPSVLLLNDRYDPHWTVRVDGKPAQLLRCNYIMRGVYLTPGSHSVEFHFTMLTGPLYVSVSAIAIAIVLGGLALFWKPRPQVAPPAEPPAGGARRK